MICRCRTCHCTLAVDIVCAVVALQLLSLFIVACASRNIASSVSFLSFCALFVSFCAERIKARIFGLLFCLDRNWHSVKRSWFFIRAMSQSCMAGFCSMLLYDLAHFSVFHSSLTGGRIAPALSWNFLHLANVLCTIVYILRHSLLGTVVYRARAMHYAGTFVLTKHPCTHISSAPEDD